MPKPRRDLSGYRNGMITVISPTAERCNRNVVWNAVCDCGTRLLVTNAHIRGCKKSKPITHCGCLNGDNKQWPAGSKGVTHKRLKPDTRAGAVRNIYAIYRWNAKDRGYCFDLTIEQFDSFLRGECYYCGGGPGNRYVNGDYVLIYNGIDRMCNDIGYIASNCVTCCCACNRSKMALGTAEWISHMRRVLSHMDKRARRKASSSQVQLSFEL